MKIGVRTDERDYLSLKKGDTRVQRENSLLKDNLLHIPENEYLQLQGEIRVNAMAEEKKTRELRYCPIEQVGVTR